MIRHLFVLPFLTLFLFCGLAKAKDEPLTATTQPVVELKEAGGHSVAFSSDGSVILTASRNAVRVWRVADSQPLTPTLSVADGLSGAAVDARAERVLAVSATVVRVWDIKTPQRPLTLQHRDRVKDAVFSGDGKSIATASLDCRVRIWDAINGKLLAELEHEEPVVSVAFDGQDKLLLTRTVKVGVHPDRAHMARNNQVDVDDPRAPGGAHVWEVAKRKRLWKFGAETDFCRGRPVFCADGSRVAIPAGAAVVCDARSGAELTRVFSGMVGGFYITLFNQAGTRLLAAGEEWPTTAEGAARVYALTADEHPGGGGQELSEKEIMTAGPMANITAAAISADGQRIAVVSPAGTGVHVSGVWDVETRRRILRWPEQGLHKEVYRDGVAWEAGSVAVSPDGRYVAVSLSKRGKRTEEGWTAVWSVPQKVEPI